jgi:hypothetical protein
MPAQRAFPDNQVLQAARVKIGGSSVKHLNYGALRRKFLKMANL